MSFLLGFSLPWSRDDCYFSSSCLNALLLWSGAPWVWIYGYRMYCTLPITCSVTCHGQKDSRATFSWNFGFFFYFVFFWNLCTDGLKSTVVIPHRNILAKLHTKGPGSFLEIQTLCSFNLEEMKALQCTLRTCGFPPWLIFLLDVLSLGRPTDSLVQFPIMICLLAASPLINRLWWPISKSFWRRSKQIKERKPAWKKSNQSWTIR